jgi:hypothetical protein
MVFRTTPQLGPQLSDVFSGIPYYDNNGITEASYRLGDKELGSDGGEYFFVKASADISATATTGTQVTLTFPAYTVATGSGGFYTPPGVAIKSGDYFHVRRGAYNAVPA